jgi:hypothetical protein
MRHMDDGALQALIDDEVPKAGRAELHAHLGTCEWCAARLDELRELSGGLTLALRTMDSIPPMLPARRRIKEEARTRTVLARTTVLRRAALFLIVSVAAVSATVPGSPVRGWLADAWQAADSGSELPAPQPVVAVAERSAVEDQPAGVSLLPGTESVQVVVTAPEAGLVLQVRLHEGSRLGVWASGAAASARFLTSQNRIEVSSPGAGELRVEIPYSAAGVALEVDGRAYLIKEGEELRVPGPGAERVGHRIRFEVVP